MRTGGPLFLVGVLALTRFTELPSLLLVGLLPAALVLAFGGRGALRATAWIACGFLWALLRAACIDSQKFDTTLERQVLQLTGVITSVPQDRPGRSRFRFAIDKLRDARGRAHPVPGPVLLSWYAPPPRLVPGQRWRLRVKLKRPWGFMDPGVRDYEAWLYQQGIRATGYVIRGRRAGVADSQAWTRVNSIRSNLRARLRRILSGEPLAPLVIALALGDRSDMTPAQWRILTRTGTSHLLAVSGLHIGLVAGLVFLLARLLWAICGEACLRLPAPRFAAFPALGAAAVYAVLAGFSVPTQRALVMLAAWLSATVLSRRRGIATVIGTALLLVLAIDPFCVLAPGFWLSFGAVSVLAVALTGYPDRGGAWWRVQVVVSIGLLPLLGYWFHQWPLASIPANLVAVPWVSLVTLPLILISCIALYINTSLGAALLHLACITLGPLWHLLAGAAAWKHALLPVPMPGVIALGTGIAGVMLAFLPRGVPCRWLALVWLLPLLWPGGIRPAPGELRFTLLDVGQGLSAIVRTADHVLVYDTGPRYSDRFNAGRAVVVPYLHSLGIGRIDLLIQSHGDNDHIGGLADVLRSLSVDRILSSVPGRIPASGARRCRAGQNWRWDGVEFRILNPPARGHFHGNNGSCVLRVTAGSHSLLLTGDIERRSEYSMLAAHVTLRSAVLVAPHHGSRTSSTSRFIAAVHPDYVLFPVGFHNRFGFPKQDIIDRYRHYGPRILDTAQSGAIDIRIGNAGISVHSQRQTARRFWQSRPDIP